MRFFDKFSRGDPSSLGGKGAYRPLKGRARKGPFPGVGPRNPAFEACDPTFDAYSLQAYSLGAACWPS